MIYEPLEEDEMMLYALLMDESGIDQAEFALVDDSKMEPVLDDEGNQIYDDEGKKKMEKGDGIFRCWPFQYPWFRDTSKRQIDSAARSVGKSMSIKLRALAFPFIHPGEEMVITAPGDNHLTLVTDNVESLYSNCRLAKEMLVKSGKGTGAITHKPFKVNFAGSNGRIVGRIPHQDGKNIKGSLRAGSLILTRDRGYIPIETVVAGDYVWSHEQVWDEVYTCYELSEEDCYFVEGQGSFGVYVNEDHRILTRNDESKQPGKVGVQLSARPSWEYVPHLQSSKYQKINSYWTSASFFGDEILPYDLPDFSRCKTSFDPEDADFWWFAGRYVADGSADVGAIKISAHPKDHSALLACLDRMGASYSISESDTSADNVNVYNAAMTKWVSEHFGHHSHTKKLPTWLLTERDWVKQAFFDGYLSGDGTEVSTGTRKEITAGSASKQLSVGMRDLAASLGYNTSCYKAIVKVTHIMGTKLKKKPQDSWRVTYSKDGRGYNDIKGFTSYKVRKITKVDPCKFYGLSTELGSYYAEGVFHHNTHPLWLEMDEACFPGETLIYTKNGHKRIEEIQVGEIVLTHKGRWRKVTNVWDRGEKEVIELKGQGHPGLRVTPNHRFWGKRVLEWKDSDNKWGIKKFSDFEWLRADSLVSSFWSSPTVLPDSGVEIPTFLPRASTGKSNKIELRSLNMLWAMGLYVAEGSTSSSYGSGTKENKTTWSIHTKEVPEVLERIRSTGLNAFVQNVKNSENAKNVVVSSVKLAPFMDANFGSGCYSKKIPSWIHLLEDEEKFMFLAGLVYGDGCETKDPRYTPGRWRLSTTSKELAFDARLLANSLGYYTSVYYDEGGKTSSIRGKEFESGPSYEVVGAVTGQGYIHENLLLNKVKSIESVSTERVYDIEVEEDHSFVAEGIVVHNSDYPPAGWVEIGETVKRDNPLSRWRAHGVTRGFGDDFDKKISGKDDKTWRVHRLPATIRPEWTDADREYQMNYYEDPIDFDRNVLGRPGDQHSPMFSLSKIMANVDQRENSKYNSEEYFNINITDHLLREYSHISELLDFPPSHKENYQNFWIGMDCGWCVDADTEIMTKRGWLRHNQVIIGVDQTLSINPQTGLSEWVTITDKFDKVGMFEMVHMEGQSFKSSSTPNHNWLVKDDSGNLRWKTTETLNTKDRVVLSTERADAPILKTYSDDFVEMVAWIFTEGTVRSDDIIEVSQSPTVNGANASRIRDLFVRFFGEAGSFKKGFDWNHSLRFWEKTEDHHGGPILYFRMASRAARSSGLLDVFLSDEKDIDPGFLVNLTNQQLLLFLDICEKGDGWTSESGSARFEQHSLARQKSYEMACALAGLPTSTGHNPDADRIRWSTSILQANTCGPVKAASFPRKSSQAMTITRDVKLRTAWCPTVRHGNWMCRKDGSIHFTGNTQSPSAITVFAEVKKPKSELTSLKLLSKVLLTRIDPTEQRDAVMEFMEFYRPQAFAVDATGAGFVLHSFLKEAAAKDESLSYMLKRIKDYNFQQKIVVGFNEDIEINEFDPDSWKEAAIKQDFLVASTDAIRVLLDSKRLPLPLDYEVISEFQGVPKNLKKQKMDEYGRQGKRKSGMHTLDAIRMAVLAHSQNVMDRTIAQHEEIWEAPEMIVF